MSDDKMGDLAPVEKPSLLEFIEHWLPFKLPRIPMPRTAKNLDKAMGKVVLSGAHELVAWMKRRSKVSDAKTEATVALIRRGSEAVTGKIEYGDDELTERAIVAAIGDSVQGQHNRERIAQFAAEELERDAGNADAPSEIDDDWLNAFSERAARISKEEMQRLWGRVLAGEIRQPGSFRLRTLQALAVIEANEAELIHRHMDLIVNGIALYVGRDDRLAKFSELLELQSIGMLQGVGSVLNLDISVAKDKPGFFRLAGDHAIRIRSEMPKKVQLVEICALTPFGKELLKLAQVDTFREGLPERLARQAMQEGLTFELVKLVATGKRNEWHVEVIKVIEPGKEAAGQ